MDPMFNASCLRCQSFLLDFCRELKEQNFVFPNSTECWFEDFAIFAERFGKRVPLNEEDFYDLIDKFQNYTMAGYKAKAGGRIGYVKGVIKYIEFTAEVDINKRGSSTIKRPYYEKF